MFEIVCMFVVLSNFFCVCVGGGGGGEREREREIERGESIMN